MPRKLPLPEKFHLAADKYVNLICSTSDLAKEFSVSKATILKWLDVLEITRHPASVFISIKMTGKESPRLGAKHSEESKNKMKASQKGHAPTTLGFKFSEESKAKMRAAWAARAIRMGKKAPEPKQPKTKKVPKPLKQIQPKRILLSQEEKLAREKCRSACKRMVRRILTMSRIKKDGRRSELLLGYSKIDLMKHLESQFKPGMSWEIRESFHIDHIKPVAQFFREGIFDPAQINALSNLQVLTADENRRKSDYYNGMSQRLGAYT